MPQKKYKVTLEKDEDETGRDAQRTSTNPAYIIFRSQIVKPPTVRCLPGYCLPLFIGHTRGDLDIVDIG
jgi:hypothetical protein